MIRRDLNPLKMSPLAYESGSGTRQGVVGDCGMGSELGIQVLPLDPSEGSWDMV